MLRTVFEADPFLRRVVAICIIHGNRSQHRAVHPPWVPHISPLGALLGRSCSAPVAVLAPYWAVLGCLGAILGRLGAVLGQSCGHLGPPWGCLGAVLGCLGSIDVRNRRNTEKQKKT